MGTCSLLSMERGDDQLIRKERKDTKVIVSYGWTSLALGVGAVALVIAFVALLLHLLYRSNVNSQIAALNTCCALSNADFEIGYLSGTTSGALVMVFNITFERQGQSMTLCFPVTSGLVAFATTLTFPMASLATRFRPATDLQDWPIVVTTNSTLVIGVMTWNTGTPSFIASVLPGNGPFIVDETGGIGRKACISYLTFAETDPEE